MTFTNSLPSRVPSSLTHHYRLSSHTLTLPSRDALPSDAHLSDYYSSVTRHLSASGRRARSRHVPVVPGHNLTFPAWAAYRCSINSITFGGVGPDLTQNPNRTRASPRQDHHWDTPTDPSSSSSSCIQQTTSQEDSYDLLKDGFISHFSFHAFLLRNIFVRLRTDSCSSLAYSLVLAVCLSVCLDVSLKKCFATDSLLMSLDFVWGFIVRACLA